MERAVPDKRYGASLSTKLIIPLSIAAKMKIKMSVSDIPYAIQDHRVLASLEYNIVDTDGNLKNGIMSKGTIRNYIKKFTADELIFTYNKAVQKYIMPSIDASATIQILDATDLEVNLKMKIMKVQKLLKINMVRFLVDINWALFVGLSTM